MLRFSPFTINGARLEALGFALLSPNAYDLGRQAMGVCTSTTGRSNMENWATFLQYGHQAMGICSTGDM